MAQLAEPVEKSELIGWCGDQRKKKVGKDGCFRLSDSCMLDLASMPMSWVTNKKQRHRQGIRTQTERNRVTRRDRKAIWAKPRKSKFKVHNPLVKPRTKHFSTAFRDSCIGSISLIWQRKTAPDIFGPWFSKGLIQVWWFTHVYHDFSNIYPIGVDGWWFPMVDLSKERARSAIWPRRSFVSRFSRLALIWESTV